MDEIIKNISDDETVAGDEILVEGSESPSIEDLAVACPDAQDQESDLVQEIVPHGVSAERIKLKRKYRRRERLLKIKQMSLVLLLFLSLGLTGYAISGLSAIRNTPYRSEAKASTKKPSKTEIIYDCFGTVGTSSLELSLPGRIGDVVAVGFHQAERKDAIAMLPTVDYFDKETTATIIEEVLHSETPVLFVMNSRGRGSALTSAVDIAMVPGAEVYSPVDGLVTTVKTYYLYNRIKDYHVEIQPEGFPEIRVAIIHINDVKVTAGERVKRRETFVGRMRSLPQISSQIHKYLPEKHDHIHIQVNPATVDSKLDS